MRTPFFPCAPSPACYYAPMPPTPDSPMPILSARLQNAVLEHFGTIMNAIVGSAYEHTFAALDLGDTISWAHEQIADELDNHFRLTDNEDNRLADFLALVFNHLEHPADSHTYEVSGITLAPGYFCPRHHALMSRNIAAFAVIASETMALYDLDEADEEHIAPLTVERFLDHLSEHGEAVSSTFKRALTDFALLGAILHVTRDTLRV